MNLILILTILCEQMNGSESTRLMICVCTGDIASPEGRREIHNGCSMEECELIQEASPPRLSSWSWWGSVWVWTASSRDQHLQMKLSRDPQGNWLVQFHVRIWVEKKQKQKKSVCLGPEYLNCSSWTLGILLPKFRSCSYIAHLPWEHVHSNEWYRNFA